MPGGNVALAAKTGSCWKLGGREVDQVRELIGIGIPIRQGGKVPLRSPMARTEVWSWTMLLTQLGMEKGGITAGGTQNP